MTQRNLAVLLALALNVAWLFGCSSKPKIDWDGRIGTYTYDQAVTDLGPPERSTVLSDGSKVTEWERDSGTSYMSFGLGTGYYRNGSSLGVGSTVYPHHHGKNVLMLTFNKDGVLKSWLGERR